MSSNYITAANGKLSAFTFPANLAGHNLTNTVDGCHIRNIYTRILG
jgi:hypothetical protein